MKKLMLFLLSLVMLGFVPVNAQKVWSLEECIMHALDNNLQIKRQELNVQYNKNNYTQSKFNTLPNLNGYFSHGYNAGKTVYLNRLDANYWSGRSGINSELYVFNGFQIINTIKENKYLFLQSQEDLKKSKNDISIQLATAYLQILFSRELVDVAKSKQDVTTMQVERTRKMMEVGNVAQGEYFQIRAQEAIDKTSLINAQNALDIAYLDLTQLLDLDSVGGFEIVVPMNIEVELLADLEPLQSIYGKALETMPQIKSAEYALKSSEKQLSRTWGQLSPSVTLSGGISSNYQQQADSLNYTYSKQFNDFLAKNISLGVSVPIFNRMQVKNAISNSKLNLEDYKLRLEQTKNALYKDVQQAHADATDAREKYYSSVEAVNYNEEAFKYTSQKMDVGLVNSVDYNIAQNNLTSAKSSMLQAKYEYIFKLKILDLYMGKPITL
jgi:outer membrane protein